MYTRMTASPFPTVETKYPSRLVHADSAFLYGSNRRQIPLPAELCPQHPSYLSETEIIFNAWRCSTSECNCDVAKI